MNQACNLILNIRYKHEFTPAVIFNKRLNTYNINLDHCLNIYVIAGIKVNGISSYQLLINPIIDLPVYLAPWLFQEEIYILENFGNFLRIMLEVTFY